MTRRRRNPSLKAQLNKAPVGTRIHRGRQLFATKVTRHEWTTSDGSRANSLLLSVLIRARGSGFRATGAKIDFQDKGRSVTPASASPAGSAWYDDTDLYYAAQNNPRRRKRRKNWGRGDVPGPMGPGPRSHEGWMYNMARAHRTNGLSKEEQRYLNQLEKYLAGEGRYPSSKKLSQAQKERLAAMSSYGKSKTNPRRTNGFTQNELESLLMSMLVGDTRVIRPPVKNWADYFGVSSALVRKALSSLVTKGLLNKTRRGWERVDPPGKSNPRRKRNPKSKSKSKTYKQARQDLLAALKADGWTTSSPNLKVIHATSWDGRFRVWIKAQAVYTERGKPFKLGTARSAWLPDIRKLSPTSFVAWANKEALK